MWRYSLLGTPIVGLLLFYLLPFAYALFVYLPSVCLAVRQWQNSTQARQK